MKARKKVVLMSAVAIAVFVSSASFEGGRGPDAEVTWDVEQNGKSATITCIICPGDKYDIDTAVSSNDSVVAVASITATTVRIGNQTCGKGIVQVLKKKAGTATVTVQVSGDVNPDVDFTITDVLFSMAVPDGVGFGEADWSAIPPGESVPIALKIIDTETGDDNPTAEGTATVTLMGDGFEFDGGGLTSQVDFVGGQASIQVNSLGPDGSFAKFEVSDDDSPGSVGGTEILETARITLVSTYPIPTLTEWGLIILSFVLMASMTYMFVKRRRLARVAS